MSSNGLRYLHVVGEIRSCARPPLSPHLLRISVCRGSHASPCPNLLYFAHAVSRTNRRHLSTVSANVACAALTDLAASRTSSVTLEPTLTVKSYSPPQSSPISSNTRLPPPTLAASSDEDSNSFHLSLTSSYWNPRRALRRTKSRLAWPSSFLTSVTRASRPDEHATRTERSAWRNPSVASVETSRSSQVPPVFHADAPGVASPLSVGSSTLRGVKSFAPRSLNTFSLSAIRRLQA
mmetsp:Transcript_1472/g.4387  ORF Transcript_1472/g.4387 Transcript_1472/m.4387 type:complete len:236 (+) Transcript_1472:1336-2043(+)